MKKLVIMLGVILFAKQASIQCEYQLVIVNKSDIQVEILSSVYHENSLNVNQLHVQTDKVGFFWFANQGDKARYMCTQSAQEATYAQIMWKYAGAFGIKTQWHVFTIVPMDDIFIFYLFKDGLIALHNRIKNSWEYKRIPMKIIGGVPLLKDLLKEQTFTRSQFIDELKKVARRVGETLPSNPFSLPSDIENGLKQGVCSVTAK